ncbi:TPA: hypothetical protein ACTXFQ_004850 [Raoultella planticola]
MHHIGNKSYFPGTPLRLYASTPLRLYASTPLRLYASTPLPAYFWHSTLLRYKARFLPEQLRRYFQQDQARRFSTVSGELKLVKVSYNWASCDFVNLQNQDGIPRRDCTGYFR